MSTPAPKIPVNIAIAPDAAVYENTPCLKKVEVAVIQQGVAADIYWQLRDRDGYPVDLAGLFYQPERTPVPIEEHTRRGGHKQKDSVWAILQSLNKRYYLDGQNEETDDQFFVEVRIQPADEPAEPMWIQKAHVTDATEGIVRFEVPAEVSFKGGIYVANIGICRIVDGRPVYVHRGLLCVERSAWRSPDADCKMPTISDIQMRIMDTDTENLLQGYVEFTTADLLDSIVHAVREWNGTTPHLSAHVYTCYSFPWIEPWLNKIIASLYQKAAMRYGRNKLQVSHGGIQGDDLNRDQHYQTIAQQHEQMWKEWMKIKKRELNLQAFSGSVSSPYGQMVNSTRGRTR